MILTGIILLSEAIPLKANCLNKLFKIKINGFDCELLTPSLPENFAEKRDKYRNHLIQFDKGIRFNKRVEWGQLYSWPDGDSSIARFKIILKLPNRTNLEEIKNDLINETKKWIDRFEDNLFAIGYNIYITPVETQDSDSFKIDYFYKSQKDEKIIHLKTDDIDTVIITIRNSIDLEDLSYVLEATSQEKKLHLGYEFLRDSQVALSKKEYRKSILDSATAFEISLTEYLKLNLPTSDKGFVDNILKMNNSISKKRALIEYTDLKLPNYDYQKDLEELRNRAIHGGKIITKNEAVLACKIVSESLKLLVKDILLIK